MNKTIKLLIILFAASLFNYNLVYAAGTSSSGDGYDNASLYKQGKKLVLRAKKLEKKIKKKRLKNYT